MKNGVFLLVDENPYLLKELEGILKKSGIGNTLKANSADSAWTLIRKQPCHCVIASWEMADMSGLALLKILRADDKFRMTPFFLTDAAFTKVKVLRAGQAAVTGLIVSPYDQKTIQSKLSRLSEKGVPAIVQKAQSAVDKGAALMNAGNYEEALAVFEGLINESENAEYYYNIGFIKTSKGEYTEAIDAFQKATELDRLFGKAYEAMGRTYKAMGKHDEARKCLQTAADLYMSKEKVEDAEEILNEILQISADSLNVFNSLGVLYRRKGDLKTSLRHYTRALRINPDEPYIHYNIGRVYLDMKNHEKAREYFENAVRIDPGFEQAKQVIQAINLGRI
jgi:tetratricopeptide (TPR) repeat protein